MGRRRQPGRLETAYVSRVLGGGGTPALDPATLALTGWWQGGNYSNGTGTWTGSASTGTSGWNLTQGTAANRPADATLNGHTIPDFDGTNDKLLSLDAAKTMNNLIAAGAFYVGVLVNVDTIATDNGTLRLNDGIWADWSNGSIGLFLKSTGPVAGVQGSTNSPTVTIATGAWKFIECRHTGGNLEIRVNGGAWTTLAQGNYGTGANTLIVGSNAFESAWLNGKMAELIFSDTAFDDTTCDGLYAYVQSRYGI